jgi:hypothetical protein
MNNLKKMLAHLTSQVKSDNVTLAVIEKPHKITDDNQSIHNGVINETIKSDLRSQSQPNAKRKRGRPAKRVD